MEYKTTEELIDQLKEIALKLHAQEDRDTVMQCVDRIQNIDSHRDYLRHRINLCEHVVGQLYIDSYESC